MSFDMHCPHGRLTTDDNHSFNSFLAGRLTWRLTNCTSQSRTRKSSESSPWFSTCSLSGTYMLPHTWPAFKICNLILPSIRPVLVLYFSPCTTSSSGRTLTLKRLYKRLRLLLARTMLYKNIFWDLSFIFWMKDINVKPPPGGLEHEHKSNPFGNNRSAWLWRSPTSRGGAD